MPHIFSLSRSKAIYIIALSLFSSAYSNPSLAQGNKRPTLHYDELYKAEQKRAEAQAIKQRDANLAANKIKYEKYEAAQKALLEKALLESVPREQGLKKQWLEWVNKADLSQQTTDFHTDIYIDKLPAGADKEALVDNQKTAEMLYEGMSVYARDLIGLAEAPFAQGLDPLIKFRQIARKGKGVGNLMLVDWTNQLIYGLLNVRSYEGNRAVIAKSQQQIALVEYVWEDWDYVKSVFEQEFQITLDYKPNSRIIEENQVANRINLRFEDNHPIGSKISYLGNSLRKNGIVEQITKTVETLHADPNSSKWKMATAFFVLAVSGNGVYGDVIFRKSDLYEFCAYLLAHPEIINLTLEQKTRSSSFSSRDMLTLFKAPLILSDKDNKYHHGNYGPFNGQRERDAFWRLTGMRRDAFQVGKPLDILKLYVPLKGIFFL